MLTENFANEFDQLYVKMINDFFKFIIDCFEMHAIQRKKTLYGLISTKYAFQGLEPIHIIALKYY